MSNNTRVDMIIETLRVHKGEKLTARELFKAKKYQEAHIFVNSGFNVR